MTRRVMAFQYWTLINDLDQWMSVLPYRAPGKAPNTKTYWVEEASCNEADPSLFDFEPKKIPFEENVQRAEEQFAEAKKLCDSCPVWHLCYAKGTPDDFFYTMRAGLEPGQFTAYKKEGRPRYRGNQQATLKDTCKRNHSDMRLVGKKKVRRVCNTCNNMTPAQKREFDELNGGNI